jgi:hypothetical protein
VKIDSGYGHSGHQSGLGFSVFAILGLLSLKISTCRMIRVETMEVMVTIHRCTYSELEIIPVAPFAGCMLIYGYIVGIA